MPEGESWADGDDPEPYADIVDECALDEEGDLYCGEYGVNDARNRVTDTNPDVVQKLRILALSDAIPNDTVAFGPDFPPDLRTQIEEALVAFADTEEFETTIGDFYTWHGIQPVDDARYDGVRDMIAEAGYSMDQIVGILEGE
jgi:phosphonate transport system substrate-binding protein